MKLTIKDRSVLQQIIELICSDFPCENAEKKFGEQIQLNLAEEGIDVDFSDWISSVDLGVTT